MNPCSFPLRTLPVSLLKTISLTLLLFMTGRPERPMAIAQETSPRPSADVTQANRAEDCLTPDGGIADHCFTERLGPFSGGFYNEATLPVGQLAHIYEFEMDQMGYFEALLDAIASDELTLLIYLRTAHDTIHLSANEGFLTTRTDSLDGKDAIMLHGLGEGTYYLVLKRKTRDMDMAIDYTLSLAQADGWPHMEQARPNDAFGQAQSRDSIVQPSLVGAWHVQGEVGGNSDLVDHWTFTLKRPSYFYAHLDSANDGLNR